jgi:hypothetical protein
MTTGYALETDSAAEVCPQSVLTISVKAKFDMVGEGERVNHTRIYPKGPSM